MPGGVSSDRKVVHVLRRGVELVAERRQQTLERMPDEHELRARESQLETGETPKYSAKSTPKIWLETDRIDGEPPPSVHPKMTQNIHENPVKPYEQSIKPMKTHLKTWKPNKNGLENE